MKIRGLAPAAGNALLSAGGGAAGSNYQGGITENLLRSAGKGLTVINTMHIPAFSERAAQNQIAKRQTVDCVQKTIERGFDDPDQHEPYGKTGCVW